MAIIVMLGWWYSSGWLWVVRQIGVRLERVGQIFAVKVLLGTWFSPWKQITSPSSFNNFFQAAADNALSRVIGSIVRSTMLLIALLWAIIVIVTGLMFVVLWPLVPISIIILPILAINGATL